MPELPDVEDARRRAERALGGRRIQDVATRPDPIVYEGVSPRRFARALTGRRVEAVKRKGKHLWMELDERPWPLFHFGMTGSFEIYRDPRERPRFWKVELAMEDGTRLAMPDARRFGRIRLQHEPERERPLADLGFDPLLDLPGAGDLARALARRLAPDLELAEVRRLRARLVAIVTRAVAVDADSERFPRTWLFHRRWGRGAGARTARGERIVHETIGGRTAAWVPT